MKRIAYVCLFTVLLAVSPARAGTKEEIMRLQSDVLALQNQIRILQQSFNERADGLRSLMGQLNDQAAATNQILNKIAATLDNQAAGGRTADQSVLQEIRNLSTKLDDQATRISALAQQMVDMKVQAKPIMPRTFQNPNDGSSAMSPDAVYNEAYNDLVQGNLDLAIEGFTAFIQNFPASDKADDALYSIGEAYYNQNKLPQAIAAFTRVLNEYPKGDKLPSAMFKRGKAELLMQERDNAIADFKSVVQGYPDSAEAGLARGELQTLGVDPTKKAPAPAPKRRRPEPF
jgi:tol-pal system protein YbgF